MTKALVPDYKKNERTQSNIYGKMAAISGVGITVGPVIGGHIVEDFPAAGFNFIALLVGVFFIINAGILYIFIYLKFSIKSHNTIYLHSFFST